MIVGDVVVAVILLSISIFFVYFSCYKFRFKIFYSRIGSSSVECRRIECNTFGASYAVVVVVKVWIDFRQKLWIIK